MKPVTGTTGAPGAKVRASLSECGCTEWRASERTQPAFVVLNGVPASSRRWRRCR